MNHKTKIYLESERVILREFTADDHHLIADLDSDPEVMRYLTNGIPSDEKEVSRVMKVFIGWTQKKNGNYGHWAAYLKDTEEFIGWYHLRPVKSDIDNFDTLELGYRLKKDFWGQGLATEVSKILIGRAFTKLNAKIVCAHTMKKNLASQNVMKKCGLKFDREDIYPEFPGLDKTTVWFQVTAKEYLDNSLS